MKKQRLWLYRDCDGFCLAPNEPEWLRASRAWWEPDEEEFHSDLHLAVLELLFGTKNLPTEMTDLFRIDATTGKALKKWEWVE